MKHLVMLGLVLMSACDDDDDGSVVDGGTTDGALGSGSDSAAVDTRAGDAAAPSGGSGGGSSMGTGGTGGVPRLTTSVSGSKQADKLSPQELTQICNDLSASYVPVGKALKSKTCKLAGFTAYLLGDQKQATCDAAVNSCLAEPPELDEGTCEGFMNCTATVAQVLTCINDQMTSAAGLLDAFPTCAQLASGATVPDVGEPPDPPSCTAIAAKCPSLLSPDT